MGIKGLLKCLNPLLVPAAGTPEPEPGVPLPPPNGHYQQYHILQFKDATLAIDASSWLHRAAYACADLLVESAESGIPNAKAEQIYTRYFLSRCHALLEHAKVKALILVFDGQRCPLKAGTNREREERRQSNLKEARRLRSEGRNSEAAEKYKLCVKATNEMALVCSKAVDKNYGSGRSTGSASMMRSHFGKQPQVRCVFAPFEADAQLARLCAEGRADAVVTEDSDILVYSATVGVPFPIIYKLDRDSGLCDVVSMDFLLSAAPTADNPANIKRDKLASLRRFLPPYGLEGKGSNKRKGKAGKKGGADGPMLMALRSMVSLEQRMPGAGRRAFVQACVLAGCDYAPSLIAGVGTVGSFKLVSEHRTREADVRFRRLLMGVRDKILPHESEEAVKDEAVEDISSGNDNLGGSESEGGSQISTASNTSSSKMKKSDQMTQRMNKYEELLAKSEAVFYYHSVADAKGNIVNLTEPQVAEPMKQSSLDKAIAAKEALSVDLSANDDDDETDLADLNLDKRKYHPFIDRFDQDITFAGSLDAMKAQGGATAIKIVSSLTKTPSVFSNPYRTESSSAYLAKGTAYIREKKPSGGPSLPDLFDETKANTKEERRVEESNNTSLNASKRSEDNSLSNNRFGEFAHGASATKGKKRCARISDVGATSPKESDTSASTGAETSRAAEVAHRQSKDGQPEDDVVYSLDDDGDDDDEIDSPMRSRHFTSTSKVQKDIRRVSLSDSAEKDKKKKASMSPASGYWSAEDDSNDCIIVDEPSPEKQFPKKQTKKASISFTDGTSFASAHRRHSSGIAIASKRGKENSKNDTSQYLSVYQSGLKDRSRVQNQSKRKSGIGDGERGGSALLAGFDRQRKRAAKDSSDLIRGETTADRMRRLSNASTSSSSGGGNTSAASRNKKRKSAPNASMKSFFQPLATTKARKP